MKDSTTRTFRMPVLTFVVATAALSQGLESARLAMGVHDSVVSFAQYGPALGALLTWLIHSKTFPSLMPARVSNRQVVAHTLLAIGACGLFGGLLAFGYVLAGGEIAGIQSIDGVGFFVITVVWLFGAGAEEIGWRGVLQPLLENGYPRWAAGIGTGLLWSIWHMSVITSGLLIASVFIASTTVLAVLMAYLGNGSPMQRVLTTTMVHWLVNIAILIVAGGGSDLQELWPELGAICITTTVFLAMFVVATRRRAARLPAAAELVRTSDESTER